MKVAVMNMLGYLPMHFDEDTEEMTRPDEWLYQVVSENGKIDMLYGDQFYRDGTVLETPDERWL